MKTQTCPGQEHFKDSDQSRNGKSERIIFNYYRNYWKRIIIKVSWAKFKALLLLLLSRFSRVRFCAAPETAAHQAPPSLGFSRQEHWSGLPFPSSMHESEKWKRSCSVVSDSLATPWTAACQAPLSMRFSRQEYWSGVPLCSPKTLVV